MEHNNSAEEGQGTDWAKVESKTSEFESKVMKEQCSNLPSSGSSHRHEHVLTYTYTHWGGGGFALAVQQGQETLGLQPITNTQISSHVHTAF